MVSADATDDCARETCRGTRCVQVSRADVQKDNCLALKRNFDRQCRVKYNYGLAGSILMMHFQLSPIGPRGNLRLRCWPRPSGVAPRLIGSTLCPSFETSGRAYEYGGSSTALEKCKRPISHNFHTESKEE